MDFSIRGQHVDGGKFVTLPDLEVRFVVRRGYLENSRPECDVDVLIRNDRQGSFWKGSEDGFSHKVAVTRILWIHGDSSVPHQGLWPGGSNLKELAGASARGIGKLIPHGVKFRALGLHDDLFVREGSQGDRAPVYHAAPPVDQTFLEKLRENVSNPLRVSLVHGEALARPVTGAAKLLKLPGDDPAVFLLPLPHALKESLAPKIMTGPAPPPHATASLPWSGWQCRRDRSRGAREQPYRPVARADRGYPEWCY